MSEKNFMAYGDAETLFTEVGTSRPAWDDVPNDLSVNQCPRVAAGTYQSNGVTFTVAENGQITANGTATATAILTLTTDLVLKSGKAYWLKGCPEGGSSSTYFIVMGATGVSNVRDYGSGVAYTANANPITIQVIVANGATVNNLTFTPMLVNDKHKNAAYTASVKSNIELEKEVANKADAADLSALARDYFDRNGLKNLVKITANSSSMAGITFTKNSDGTITVNGTNASSSSAYYIAMNVGQDYIKPGKYTLSGVGNVENVSIRFRYNTGSNVNLAIISSATPMADFEITQAIIDSAVNGFNLVVYVSAGATISNAVISPMVRFAGMSDDTFKPHVPTNEELADRHLYLHSIEFAIKSIKEMVEEGNFEDSFRNNKTAVAIGVHKIGLNGTWEELVIDGTQSAGGPTGGVQGDIKNGGVDYIGTTSVPQNKIRVYIVSKISDPFTNLTAIGTHWRNGDILASLNPHSYNYTSLGVQYQGDQGTFQVFHIDSEISGNSYGDYVNKWENGSEEAILLLDDYKVKNFTDTVSVWL